MHWLSFLPIEREIFGLPLKAFHQFNGILPKERHPPIDAVIADARKFDYPAAPCAIDRFGQATPDRNRLVLTLHLPRLYQSAFPLQEPFDKRWIVLCAVRSKAQEAPQNDKKVSSFIQADHITQVGLCLPAALPQP
jgi:hypothetical protein